MEVRAAETEVEPVHRPQQGIEDGVHRQESEVPEVDGVVDEHPAVPRAVEVEDVADPSVPVSQVDYQTPPAPLRKACLPGTGFGVGRTD